MGHIKIAYRCEQTPDGLWVPAFELSLSRAVKYGFCRRSLPPIPT
jgi:hypothetical protein